MADKFLYVMEGSKPERQILSNLGEAQSIYGQALTHQQIVHVYGGRFDELYRRMQQDEFQDTFPLLLEVLDGTETNPELIGCKRSDFSGIFLFYDFDPPKEQFQDHLDRLQKMVEYFSNETEQGKLFVHYPMVEAVRDFRAAQFDYNGHACKLADIYTYKDFVGKNSDFLDVRKYDHTHWELIVKLTCQKVVWINDIAESSTAPKLLDNLCSQDKLLQKQKSKIQTSNSIYVFSGFPFFLIYLFGEKMTTQVIGQWY